MLTALALFGGVPTLLAWACQQRLGSWSPLTGTRAPWHWTADGMGAWFRSIGDGVADSDHLVDLVVRVGSVVAWLCLAMLAAVVVGEIVHLRRFGVPSGQRRSWLGLGRLGRWLAAGLLAALPMIGQASPVGALPRAVPVATPVQPRVGPVVRGPASEPAVPVAAPIASVYVVRPGDSIWSIAEEHAGTRAVSDYAAELVRTNLGRTMPDGHRFVTAALIEPGWNLTLPPASTSSAAVTTPPATPATSATPTTPASSATPAVPSPPVTLPTASPATPAVPSPPATLPAPAPSSTAPETHVVVQGDSYWRITEQHLDAVSGHQVSEREIFEQVDDVIAANAPRLGYADPAMLHPGDVVSFPDAPAAPAPPSTPATPTPATPTPAPTPSGQVGTSRTAQPPRGPDGVRPGASPERSSPVPPPATAVTPPTVAASAATRPPTPPTVTRVTAARPTPPTPARVPPSAAALPTTVPDAGRDTVPVFAPPDPGAGAPNPVPVGLAGGGLLVAGAIGLIESRRRARLRRARAGQRLRTPHPEVATTETRVRRYDATELVVRLDLALRAAALDLADQQAQVPVAFVDPDGTVRLKLDVAAAPSARWWRVEDSGGVWVLPADVDVTTISADARRSAQPCPTMVHLGHATEGELFVDVETVGLLCVEHAPGLVRAIAGSLALSPLAEPVQLLALGMDELTAMGSGRVESGDAFDAALRRLRDHAAKIAPLTSNATTLRLRARRVAPESTEPFIVASLGRRVLPALHNDMAELLTPAGRGIGMVIDEVLEGATVIVRHDHDRLYRLEPWGIEFDATRLTEHDITLVAALIDEADPLLVEPGEDRGVLVVEPRMPIDLAAAEALPTTYETGDEVGVDAVGEPDVPFVADDVHWATDSPKERDWKLMVTVLGRVSVVDRVGADVAFERGKALELVVWLSQHRQRSSRALARTALWDLDVRDATFANVVSDARRAMAKAVLPPDGDEWIGRTLADHLPLHPDVVTDAEMLAAAVEAAKQVDAAAALDWLRAGLGLVSGVPFAGSNYQWPDAEGLTSALILLITGAAEDLARRELAVGNIDGLFWATQRGLSALPGHEELIVLRMQAHAQRGDLSGVRSEWESYERALRADIWGTAEPAPKVVSMRQQLLGGSTVAR